MQKEFKTSQRHGESPQTQQTNFPHWPSHPSTQLSLIPISAEATDRFAALFRLRQAHGLIG